MTVRIIAGDCRAVLADLPAASVQCVVTSPPYFSLRSYLPDDHPDKALEIGIEPTPDAYVAGLVSVFRGVRRVLRDDGTCWLNLGDTWASAGGPQVAQTKWQVKGASDGQAGGTTRKPPAGAKPKDLLGIPWRVAFALQADGWWVRSAIVWEKPNAMPERVKDRPTKSYEMLFLLTKSDRYYYDNEAIAEPAEGGGIRNARDVWSINTRGWKGAHFAVMPPELVVQCIKAGSRAGDTVLDPFFGSGTTGAVASGLGRDCIGIDLNPEYAELARRRIAEDAARRAPPADEPDLFARVTT